MLEENDAIALRPLYLLPQALHTRDLKSGVDLSDPALAQAWAKVRDNKEETTWVLYR